MVVVVKDLGICKQVELIVKNSNKTFDSTILLVVSRERRLPHWYGFAELYSFFCASCSKYGYQVGCRLKVQASLGLIWCYRLGIALQGFGGDDRGLPLFWTWFNLSLK